MSPAYTPGKLVLRRAPSTWAEGGDSVSTIVVSGTTYRVHTFTTSGTSSLTVLNGGNVEYLVVAGGGGGGWGYGAGGGAGGMLAGSAVVNASSYPVVIGSGGVKITGAGRGNSGGNSSIFSLTAIGGGGGGSEGLSGLNGGSGGGGSAATTLPAALAGNGTTGQGNAGFTPTSTIYAGGGGGAGGVSTSNVGGIGLQNSITGTPIYYAGGGSSPIVGGVVFVSTTLGGGGGTNIPDGVNGLGGGGMGYTGAEVGAGGSGIVIVRYAI